MLPLPGDRPVPLMILVAGPYRSGTNDNPELIARNVRAMTERRSACSVPGTSPSSESGSPCR